MPAPHPLPDALAELIAERFRVIGEPMRIRLLDRLLDGEASVGELTAALGATQQNVSKHLGVLHRAGIVSRRKEGNHAYYEIADESVLALCEQVCGSLTRQLTELAGLLGASAEEAPAASGAGPAATLAAGPAERAGREPARPTKGAVR